MLNVPKTKIVAPKQAHARMVGAIDHEERVYLNDRPVNINQFAQEIKAESDDPQEFVYLECAAMVRFEIWASVLDALNQSGITNIDVVTQSRYRLLDDSDPQPRLLSIKLY